MPLTLFKYLILYGIFGKCLKKKCATQAYTNFVYSFKRISITSKYIFMWPLLSFIFIFFILILTAGLSKVQPTILHF